jgi:hypothetical protein
MPVSPLATDGFSATLSTLTIFQKLESAKTRVMIVLFTFLNMGSRPARPAGGADACSARRA